LPALDAGTPTAANDFDPRNHRRDPDGKQAGKRVPAPVSLARIRDLGKEAG
jgi:hypothetical protein